MDFTDYNEFIAKNANESQMRESIHEILLGICDKKHDIVLDIGCSGGQLTALLDKEITVGHIYGVDINEDVIEFAKQNNNTKDNISYVAQDIVAEFDRLAPELKALEGQVSLIFSHSVFQLIDDVKNLSINMYRMLSNGGEVCASFRHVFDPYSNLTPEEKAIHEKEFMKMPDQQKRLDNMFRAFKDVGFDVISVQNFNNKIVANFTQFKQLMLPTVLLEYKQYLVVKDEEKVTLMMKALEERLIASRRRFTNETTGEEIIENERILTIFRLRK